MWAFGFIVGLVLGVVITLAGILGIFIMLMFDFRGPVARQMQQRKASGKSVSLLRSKESQAGRLKGVDREWKKIDQESAVWLNTLSARVWDELADDANDLILRDLQDRLSKLSQEDENGKRTLPSYIAPIIVDDFDFGNSAPKIEKVHTVCNSVNEVSMMVVLSYSGEACIAVSTSVLVDWPYKGFGRLPICVDVSINHLSLSLCLNIEGVKDPLCTVALQDPPKYELGLSSTIGHRNKVENSTKVGDLILDQVAKALDSYQDVSVSFHIPILGRATRLQVDYGDGSAKDNAKNDPPPLEDDDSNIKRKLL